MLIKLYFEKEVVIMINKASYTNAKVSFNLVTFSSIFTSKTLYDSPTLVEIIFS